MLRPRLSAAPVSPAEDTPAVPRPLLTEKRRAEPSLVFMTQATCTHDPQHCPLCSRYSKPCGEGARAA